MVWGTTIQTTRTLIGDSRYVWIGVALTAGREDSNMSEVGQKMDIDLMSESNGV